MRRASRQLSNTSSGALSSASTPTESKIPRPSFSARTSSLASDDRENGSSIGRFRGKGSSISSHRLGRDVDGQSVNSGSDSDRVQVTVRLRPLSERELARGDQEVWKALDEKTIGVNEDGEAKIKYAFDRVFDNQAANKQIYGWSAKRIVGTAMDGLNATIFAYGVTSSGKTYTMMGTQEDPGIVQRTIRDVFRAIEDTPDRDYLLRFSMLEIYNEVLNDLLDPSSTNLKLRESPSKGFFVEGIKEETLVSAEHALSVIAAGDANRKVAATAFNEGSSRSHTLMRLSIESSERPGPDHDPRLHLARTLSFLNLIDLAGSESAKATITKGHAREGSYINKSLLTLGTVIAKLSDGNAVHIPFRDSKLTRLLQASMTGSGARVSVIATITPASCQAEETHNTLKFATRAKKIEIHAQRNEILDQSSLILRYQAEIKALRAQLEEAARGRGVALTVDPLHPEVRNLRERLEEEHQALLQREQDKAALEMRISRLTRIILSSTKISKADVIMNYRYRDAILKESSVQRPAQGDDTMDLANEDEWMGHQPASNPNDPLDWAATVKRGEWQAWEVNPDVAATVSTIQSVGDIIPGYRLMSSDLNPPKAGEERDREMGLLKEQLAVLSEEFERLDTLGDDRSNDEANEALEVDLQIMSAERDFLETKVRQGRSKQEGLVTSLQTLRRQLLEAGLDPKVPLIRLQDLDDDLSASDAENQTDDDDQPRRQSFSKQNGYHLRRSLESTSTEAGVQAGSPSRNPDKLSEADSKSQKELDSMRQELKTIKEFSEEQEARLTQTKQKLQQVSEREKRVQESLRTSSREAKQLRTEMERLEVVNNNLQGYGLDEMTDEDIHVLIARSQQAMERMIASLQMRRMEEERRRVEGEQREAAKRVAAQQQAQREAREAASKAAAAANKSPGPTPIGPYQPMRIALHKG